MHTQVQKTAVHVHVVTNTRTHSQLLTVHSFFYSICTLLYLSSSVAQTNIRMPHSKDYTPKSIQSKQAAQSHTRVTPHSLRKQLIHIQVTQYRLRNQLSHIQATCFKWIAQTQICHKKPFMQTAGVQTATFTRGSTSHKPHVHSKCK